MKSAPEASRINRPMLYTLVVAALVWLVSVVTSGHDPYIEPPPLQDQASAYTATADPRNLASSSEVVYSFDTLSNGTRNQRIGHRTLIANRDEDAALVGWAIDAGDLRPALTIYARLDAGPIRGFPLTTIRPDVAGLYQSHDFTRYGFRVPIDIARSALGRHVLRTWITTSDGLATLRPPPLLITVTGSRRPNTR